MKTSLAAIAIAALTLSLSPALAQNAPATTPAPAPMAGDAGTSQMKAADFATKAAGSNMFEIVSSKVALQKASSDDVKSFAQQMIDDHTKAGQDMEAAAKQQGGITVPTAMDDAHQKMVDQLNSQSGDGFDSTYIQMQTAAHKEAVDLFTSFSQNGEEGALKDFAAKTLPTLQHHYEMVQQLAQGGDAAAPAGGNGAMAPMTPGNNAMAPAPGAAPMASNPAANPPAPDTSNATPTPEPMAPDAANPGAPATGTNMSEPGPNPAPAPDAGTSPMASDANAPAAGDNAAATPTDNTDDNANNDNNGGMLGGGDVDISTLKPVDLTTLKGDDLKGTDVINSQGEKIASINDFVLSDDGAIDALIVDFGGFLGIGTKQVALGFDNLDFMTDDNNHRYLVVDLTKEQLDAQTPYNKDDYAQSRDTQRLTVDAK